MSVKCPKCGHENPDGILFCEECDWRTDVPYVPEKKRNPVAFAAATIVLGVIAIVCAFVEGGELVALIVGAVAVVLGGYSMGVVRVVESKHKSVYLVVAAVGLLLGVVGFVMGFAAVAGALRWRSTGASTSSRDSPRSARPWSTTWTWPTTSACRTGRTSPARCAAAAATSPT